MQAILGILLILFGYLFGSIPSGFWIAKLIKGKNFDIRNWGSGNIGATNVLRVLGWKTSLPVFVADFLKGLISALLASHYAGEGWGVACLMAAVLGHAFSLVMLILEGRFSGGKSVATAFGGLVALQPIIALGAFGLFLIVLFTTRYLSLASMTAATFAFILAIGLQKNPFWIWTLAALALFMIYTHRRNIGNLLSGVEHKFGQSFAVHGEEEGLRTAFVIHSLKVADLEQIRLSAWLAKLQQGGRISARKLRWLVARFPVIKVDEIIGIVDATGKPATIIILGIPMLPDQLKAAARGKLEEATDYEKKLAQILDEQLKRATVLAQRMGATVVGLGALLSSAASGGANLQKWAREERQLTITVDNGGAYTAAATLNVLRQIKPDLSKTTIAVIGASGVIGIAIVFYLRARRQQIGELMLFARSKSKIQEHADIAKVLTSDELGMLAQADVVISATSSEEPIITAENASILKPGAVVLDLAVPADVVDEVVKARPDITLIRCGLILLPCQAQTKVDFHFGSLEIEGVSHPLFPACLAQGLLLASTGDYAKASQGIRAITPEVIDWFIATGQAYGCRVIPSQVDERGIWLGTRKL